MVQQVTNGIKISVKTRFEGSIIQNLKKYYAFTYKVTIENQSNDSVQLLNRHWKIFDSLNALEVVDGCGVIGKKPIIRPRQTHTYISKSILTSHIGAMKGFFKMVNFTTTKTFKVYIPTFQLMVKKVLN